jgi:hypothetical protein
MYNNPYSSYPYYNYGNANYGQRPYAPQVQQSPQPQMQAPVMSEMPIQDIKFVDKAQAEAYIAFPNTKVMLIDNDNKIVYIKTADNMGQSKTEYFKFEPVNADGTPIVPVAPTTPIMPQIDKEHIQNLGFVTVEDYERLLKELDAIKRQIVNTKPISKPENARSAQ